MEAEINGPQRKVVRSEVRPLRGGWDRQGIPLRSGRTLPFVVTREWSAPAGTYLEAWYLIDPKTREVLYEGPVELRQIWGLQSLTEVSDVVAGPIPLAPGTYQIVFALGGIKGGELDVEAAEAPVEEAA